MGCVPDTEVDHHQQQLNIMFLPFIAPGHMIPMVDIARLFTAAPHTNAKVTIITTTHNALIFQNSITRDIQSGHHIQLHILPFPYLQVGLPEGVENFNSITTPDMSSKLYQAIGLLKPQMEELLKDQHPDCIVSDMFYPWTADVAAELNIPRLVFHGTSFFALSAMDAINRFSPHESVASDTEQFVIPEFPDRIEMTRLQLPDHVRTKKPYSYMLDMIRESEKRSYGTLVNSFYELEPAYADHFRKSMGRKAWHIGPVSLFLNKDDKVERGHNSVVDSHECLSWLDSRKPKSVLYVSFGSLSKFPKAQLNEIAFALESSGHPFIWVVRKRDEKDEKKEGEEEKWLPDGFEERMKESKMGMIIRGWAPQVLILEHGAIGGFMTHCGWNSVLESVTAGVPMIAWPLYAEQFYNEKLVTEVLKIGVGVGVEEWDGWTGEEGKVLVKRNKIEKAVIRLMDGGDEAEEVKKRVMDMGEKAKMAVEGGGSSKKSLGDLIGELVQLRGSRINTVYV